MSPAKATMSPYAHASAHVACKQQWHHTLGGVVNVSVRAIILGPPFIVNSKLMSCRLLKHHLWTISGTIFFCHFRVPAILRLNMILL